MSDYSKNGSVFCHFISKEEEITGTDVLIIHLLSRNKVKYYIKDYV